jgi:hypothetical protein
MDKTHWLDEPRHVKVLWRLFLGILVLVVVIGALIPLHPHFDLESLFGFYAWFGFIACAVMILVAKGLALLIKRPDTYYRERND